MLNPSYVPDDLNDRVADPPVVLTRVTRIRSSQNENFNINGQQRRRNNQSANNQYHLQQQPAMPGLEMSSVSPVRSGRIPGVGRATNPNTALPPGDSNQYRRQLSNESDSFQNNLNNQHDTSLSVNLVGQRSITPALSSPTSVGTGHPLSSAMRQRTTTGSGAGQRRVSIKENSPIKLRNGQEQDNAGQDPDEMDPDYRSSRRRASKLISQYTQQNLFANIANGGTPADGVLAAVLGEKNDAAMEEVKKLPPKLARQFTCVSFAGGYPTSLTKINNDLMFELRWLELYFTVYPKFYQFKKKPVTLLNNVSGRIKSGQLVALMGPSGCGKSTLLDCIGGRRPWGISNGAITVNGGISKVRVALVPQKDEFYDRFSVTETIMYASKLKNPHFSAAQHANTVAKVIRHLGLEVCQNVKVHKCSGGQQKRISIAQELVSKPNVLLLDEPTSGLDSSTCFQTLFLLTRLAHNPAEPMAVMISIHQPSARMFALFDHVYFMAYRGTCVYEGPPKGIPERLLEVNLELPPQCNTADFMMEVASHDYGTEPVEKLKAIHANGYETEKITHLDRPLSSVLEKPNFPFWYHCWILITRACVAINRDPILMGLRLIAHLLVPVLLGILFSDRIGKTDGCPRPSVTTMEIDAILNLTLKPEVIITEYQTMVENCGFLYLTLLLLSMMTIGITVLTFPLDSHIFIKEYKNGWYSIFSYFIGRSLAEIFYQSIFVIIYLVGACYWTGQPWSFARFMAMFLIVLLTNLFSQTTGLIIGAILINNLIASVFMTAVVTLPLALFTSFFVRERAMAGWMVRAISASSYFSYGFKGLIAVTYGFGRCKCPGLVGDAAADAIIGSGDDDGGEGSGDYAYEDGDYGDNGTVGSNATTAAPGLGPVYREQRDPNVLPSWLRQFSNSFNLYLENHREIDASTLLPHDPKLNAMQNRDVFTRLIRNMEYSYLRWTSNCTDYKPIAMAEFDVTEYSFFESVIALIIMVIIMRVITYMVLLARVKN